MKFQNVFFSALVAFASLGMVSAQEDDAAAGELVFVGDSIELSLKKPNLHSYVQVDFGDGELHNFIIDTGADVNVLDVQVSKDLGFETIGQTEIGAPGGAKISANIVNVPMAKSGDLGIQDAEFVTMDFAGMTGGTTQGVLGMGLFREFLLTLDPGNERAVVSHASLSQGQPGVVSYDSSGGQIEIEMNAGGVVIPTHLDTGATAEFTLPSEMIGALPLKGEPRDAGNARLVGGQRKIQVATLDGSINFAGSTYKDPDLLFMDPSAPSGNIGNMILDEFALSIDQKNKLVAFRKTDGKSLVTANNKRRRLGIRFRGMPGGSVLNVASVDPGSIGEKAGFQAGDVMLTLNGRPTEEYDMSELGALFGSASPLNFEIDRSGTSVDIEIP